MKASNKPSSTDSAPNPTDFSMTGKPVAEVGKGRIGKWMSEKAFAEYLQKQGKLPPAKS